MQTVNGVGTTIYGRAKKEELSGAERIAAEEAGYIPVSFQVTKWFVVLFLPIVPLGTYRVLKAKQGFWTADFPQYSMTPILWDWHQIAWHYAAAYGWIVILLAVALFFVIVFP
jgi:hypothetical protein